TSSSDIYNSNSGRVGIGATSFLGNEKLRIIGDINTAGTHLLGKTVNANAIPTYLSGFSGGQQNVYTINATSTYNSNYNFASENILLINGYGLAVGGYQSGGTRNAISLNNATYSNPATGHTWSATTNSITTSTVTADRLINTYLKSQFVNSTVTNFYDL